MQEPPDARGVFIEEMAIFMDEAGLPRMAGRVLGLLLVCSPPHLSAGEMGASLQASKGSISTMTRMLINMGFVERIGLPQQRQSYFRIRPGVWSGLLKTQVGKVAAARALAARGIQMLKEEGIDADGRLGEMHDLYGFLERELPSLLARWEAEHSGIETRIETLTRPHS
ncbi:MarR family transcriptional regulator [soil metagenome]